MGADIKQLRTRIKSVDSTLHLTKAMELVASSKIRRATEAMEKSREYADALADTVRELATYEECKRSSYMRCPDGNRMCLVVVAGDRGLAGGYNANIFRLMRDYPDAKVIPIGKRACDRYGGEVRYAEKLTYAEAKAIADELCHAFTEGEFDVVGIVCTKYHNLMSQEAYLCPLFPVERREDTPSVGAIFEPNEVTVLNAIIPEYIAGTILACVRESFACEVAARRVAMDSAGKNASEMIDRLSLEYNRARQGAITQEITEIVAGSGM